MKLDVYEGNIDEVDIINGVRNGKFLRTIRVHRIFELFTSSFKKYEGTKEIRSILDFDLFYDLNGVVALFSFVLKDEKIPFLIDIRPYIFHLYCEILCELWYCKKHEKKIQTSSLICRIGRADEYLHTLLEGKDRDNKKLIQSNLFYEFLAPEYRSRETELLEILKRHYYIPTEINNGLKKTDIGNLFAYLKKEKILKGDNKRIAPLFANFLGFTTDPKDTDRQNYIGNSTIYNGSYKEMRNKTLKTDIERFVDSIF